MILLKKMCLSLAYIACLLVIESKVVFTSMSILITITHEINTNYNASYSS